VPSVTGVSDAYEFFRWRDVAGRARCTSRSQRIRPVENSIAYTIHRCSAVGAGRSPPK
jgi:hypothetical protein